MKPIIILGVIAFLGWKFVLPIFNGYQISENAPLGMIEKMETEILAAGLFSTESASVTEWELDNRQRFNGFSQRRYYQGGQRNQTIKMGDDGLPEMVAVAADEDGQVQMVIIRMQSTEGKMPTTVAQLAHEYFKATTGHKPNWSAMSSEDHGNSSTRGQRAEVDASGLDGFWKSVKTVSVPTMVYEEPKNSLQLQQEGHVDWPEDHPTEGKFVHKKVKTVLNYEFLLIYQE